MAHEILVTAQRPKFPFAFLDLTGTWTGTWPRACQSHFGSLFTIFIFTVGVIDLLKRLEVKKALTNTGDERGRIQLVTLGCEFSLCKQMPVCVTTYG